MRIIHTADWHIGKEIRNFDRSFEYQNFFAFLRQTIKEKNADALIMSGDIFDVPMPSNDAEKLLGRFLSSVLEDNPNFEILMIAGNHDSSFHIENIGCFASLSSNVHIIGVIPGVKGGSCNDLDYSGLVVSLKDKTGRTGCLTAAVPFLRPVLFRDKSLFADGMLNHSKSEREHEVFKRVWNVIDKRDPEHKLPHIAVGHSFVSGAEMNSDERKNAAVLYAGGEQNISEDVYAEADYAALGHIHKAQNLKHINGSYSGSPLPINFGEKEYQHSINLLETGFDDAHPAAVRLAEKITVPRTVQFIRLPDNPNDLLRGLEGLKAVEALPDNEDIPAEQRPFLSLNLVYDPNEPGVGTKVDLREKINQLLMKKEKSYRICEFSLNTVKTDASGTVGVVNDGRQLIDISPKDVLEQLYHVKCPDQKIPAEAVQAFSAILAEIENKTDNKENDSPEKDTAADEN